jgi:hypothetical protein
LTYTRADPRRPAARLLVRGRGEMCGLQGREEENSRAREEKEQRIMRRSKMWRWTPVALLLAMGGTTGRAGETATNTGRKTNMNSGVAKGSRIGTGMLALAVLLCWASQVPRVHGGGGGVGVGGGGGMGMGGQAGAGGGGGGVFVPAPAPKVTLARLVDAEGKVDYQTFTHAAAMERRQKAMTEAYNKAVAWREKVDASLTAKGFKNEKSAPVAPVVEVIKKDVTKRDASAATKDAKDWAVYEIEMAGATKRQVAYAHSDVFAQAIADADFAKVYNKWVLAGKKEGQEPKPFTVKKVSEAATKAQAETGRMQKEKPTESTMKKPVYNKSEGADRG